jgi:hypothetical protein
MFIQRKDGLIGPVSQTLLLLRSKYVKPAFRFREWQGHADQLFRIPFRNGVRSKVRGFLDTLHKPTLI